MGFEPATFEWLVQHSNHWATRPGGSRIVVLKELELGSEISIATGTEATATPGFGFAGCRMDVHKIEEIKKLPAVLAAQNFEGGNYM